MQRWIKRNPTEAALTGGAIVLLLFNLGGIKDSLSSQATMRQSTMLNQQQVQQMQIDAEKKRELAEVANQRYDAGCELLLSLERPDHYRALAEGTAVLDGAMIEKYGKTPGKAPPEAFIPAGKTICDVYGNTAVLVNEPMADKGGKLYPVMRQMATTEDRERIRKAMQRVQAKWSPIAN